MTSISAVHCAQNSTSNPTECLIGSSCTDGRAKLCLPGEFSNDLTGSCSLCQNGNFGQYHGLTECTDSCADGFYCENGASSGFPSRGNDTGFGICPVGHFCQDGTRTQCQPGTYQDRIGQSECSGQGWKTGRILSTF